MEKKVVVVIAISKYSAWCTVLRGSHAFGLGIIRKQATWQIGKLNVDFCVQSVFI